MSDSKGILKKTSFSNGNNNNKKNYGSVVVINHEDVPNDPRKNPPKNPKMFLHQASELRHTILIKTQSTFRNDLLNFAEGSIPHSMILALIIGVVCGISAYIYYAALEWALEFFWNTLPIDYFHIDEKWGSLQWLWIIIIGFTLATCVGITVVIVGEPGDLPYTIKCVHDKAFVSMDHILPMLLASQFSILAGGSLGPEAPLVAICAALGGFISKNIFGCTERNLIRKHTLMGMAGALAAFFGVPLGGSLFALEVNSRFGIEYFEHTVEAIFSGEICLIVFRALAGLPLSKIWNITDEKLPVAEPIDIVYGLCIGLLGAGVAATYATMHWFVMSFFRKHDLLDNKNAIQRVWIGASVVITLGVLIPHTMFWGEFEFQTISTMSPANTLEHVYPTSGLLQFEMTNFTTALITGIAKLIAISATVAGGYRGGYIFPLFAAGAALGRAIYFIFPFIPVQLCVLCMAASINVAVTRTSIATTLILAFLSGEQCAISAILAASLISLFVTGYMPFIATQVSRVDLHTALYATPYGDEDDSYNNESVTSHGDETEPLTPYEEQRKHANNDDNTDQVKEISLHNATTSNGLEPSLV